MLENGKPLDWIVADKAMVEERDGSFCHFGAFVRFTSSDGTDPRTNGRVYEVAIPKAFNGLERSVPLPENGQLTIGIGDISTRAIH